jgi:hypothetical protein
MDAAVGRHRAMLAGLPYRRLGQRDRHPVHLAPGTVRYLSAAMTKLGVSSRHAAAHRAWEQGWI